MILNKKGLMLAALLTAVLPRVLLAYDVATTETIVVTATRSEISIHDSTVPVTVIDRQQIEQSLAKDLSELLRFEAGLDIGRNGGPGQATSIFLRGTESNHTLLLIDGVRTNPGTIGGAAFQNIAPEMIDRIEIVKGARSALYGTEAIGGVINVITRQAKESSIDLSLGYGSFDTRSGTVIGGLANEDGKLGASVNWNTTNGYQIRSDSDIERGYDNLTFNAYGSHTFGSGEIGLRHWQSSGTVEYLDFFLAPVDQDFDNQTTALELLHNIGESATSKLILSFMSDQIQQNQSPDFVKSERLALDWQYALELQHNTLAAGVYLVDENARAVSFGSGFDEDTSVKALFLQDSIESGRHRGFLAARYTDHETFGKKLTWNAEYAFDYGERLTLTAGLGTAFRAPDATDRFGFGGNINLKSESAEELQLGARFQLADRHALRLELYANDIDKLIEFDFATFTMQNIGKAEIRGVELGYDYRGDNFTVHASVVSQTAENADTGSRLLRRANESLTVRLTRSIGEHRLGLTILASGKRQDFAATLPGYMIANLTAQFKIGDKLQLNARIENIFDKQYETASKFRMQELSGFVDLKYLWR